MPPQPPPPRTMLFKGCRPVPPTPPLGASPGFFCSGSGFWLVQACWLAGLLARLIACLFSALFQAALVCPHSEHQPKERYMESRQQSVPSFASSALGGRTRFAAASTNQRSAPAACSAAAECLTSHLSPTCSKAIGAEGAASHKSFASRAFPGRTRLSTASANERSAPAAERKRKATKGVRRKGEKGRTKAVRAGRERASALKTVPCRCSSAVLGRTRLPPTASTNQRSAKTGRTDWP